VYDIFGPASQTLQGADGIATALGALVLVPDLLEGKYASPKVCPFLSQLVPVCFLISASFGEYI
jgi:hypothetical protein